MIFFFCFDMVLIKLTIAKLIFEKNILASLNGFCIETLSL